MRVHVRVRVRVHVWLAGVSNFWPSHFTRPGMLLTSAVLLVYTAMIVPIQICMWNYDDPCNMFPTLFFDVFVDIFFMVRYFVVCWSQRGLRAYTS